MQVAYSVNGVPIRLTDERWAHIVRNKPYMAAYKEQVLRAIERPTWVLEGYAGAQVAVLRLRKDRNLHVVYRELGTQDGFVITAFMARKVNKEKIIWPKRSSVRRA